MSSYRSLFSFIWPFIRQQGIAFSILFVVSLVWAFDATVWPYILQKIINVLTQYESMRSAVWPALLPAALSGLTLWFVIDAGFRLQGFLLMRTVPKLEADIRMAMFDHTQRHSPRYFNEHLAGRLANKINDMSYEVSQIVDTLLTMLFPALVAAGLALAFFASLNSWITWILAVWMVGYLCIVLFFLKRCNQREEEHGEIRSTLIGHIVDSLTNNFVVNLFYRFAYEKRALELHQRHEQRSHTVAKRTVELMRLYMSLWTSAVMVGIGGLMLYFWSLNRLNTGEVLQIFNTMWNLIMVLWVTGTSMPELFRSFGLAKQALSIMQDPQDIADQPNAVPLIVTRGEIVFDNVSFRYTTHPLFSNKIVKIRSGEKIGLVGYSGAGKTTFLNLILRFYAVESGRILIDGQDISQVTLESLRTQVSLIPQDPLLFHRSIKDNIRYGRVDASDAEIFEAAKLAHCDGFIQRLPEGYDTLVGERGTKLSGGERQRIAIARAILANSPILILDEATSALDSVTEKYIQESMRYLMKNRTTIAVAHRLSTLTGLDRLLVFHKGSIIEQGSHAELLQKGGHYAKLWQMQAGGFIPSQES